MSEVSVHGPGACIVAKLYFLNNAECSFPGCGKYLADESGGGLDWRGNAAHIKGLRQGAPRFDSTLTVQERNALANLILLCRDHHYDEVDATPSTYTVEILSRMKSEHEEQSRVRRAIGQTWRATVHEVDYLNLRRILLDSEGSTLINATLAIAGEQALNGLSELDAFAVPKLQILFEKLFASWDERALKLDEDALHTEYLGAYISWQLAMRTKGIHMPGSGVKPKTELPHLYARIGDWTIILPIEARWWDRSRHEASNNCGGRVVS